MIYLIGGAPRAGKSVLGQQLAANLRIGWLSTDLMMDLLRAKAVEGIKSSWDASPEAITANAAWFFPCLARFVWGADSMAGSYVIEGVDFLPAQVAELAEKHPIRTLFLGCSTMTLARLDQFPGRSRGYAGLPKEMRCQIAQDVPAWSEFIRQEAERFNYPYLDMSDDFTARLAEAEVLLITGSRTKSSL